MTEVKEMQKPLDLILDRNTFNVLIRKIAETRKDTGDGRTFTYSEVSHSWGDKLVKVQAKHFPLDIVLKNGNSSCNDCYGKGYNFINIPKSQYPDPRAFLLDENTLPKDLTPEEQKKWREEQKNISTWRIMKICDCAVKRTHNKYPGVLSNAYHNIWMTLDYEIIKKEN